MAGTLVNVAAVASRLKTMCQGLAGIKRAVIGIATQIGESPHIEIAFREGRLWYGGAQRGEPPGLRSMRFDVSIFLPASSNLDDAEITLYGHVDALLGAFWVDRSLGGLVATSRIAVDGITFDSVAINEKLYRRATLVVWAGDLNKEGL